MGERRGSLLSLADRLRSIN